MQRMLVSKSSLVLSAIAGILGTHAGCACQGNVLQDDFLALGVSYGRYFIQCQGFQPVVSCEDHF